LKIAQYIISLLHMIGQITVYMLWSNGFETIMRNVPSEKGQVTSTIVLDMATKLSRHNIKFLFFGLLILAVYLTLSIHLGHWINEAGRKES